MATEQQEIHIKKIVIDREYVKGLENKTYETQEFESIIDMLECERTEKNADWRSDIFVPQFFSQIITQASGDATEMFQNRDFVETYISDGRKTDAGNATERLLNRTLNQKHLYHYQKYMRARMITYLNGKVVARLWWEKETESFTRTETRLGRSTTNDIFGDPLMFDDQTPDIVENEVEVEDERIVVDRFNYDILDPRNVFTDNSYVYSLQEKESVIIRSETTLDKLEDESERNEYFDLDKLKDVRQDGETDTSKETFNQREPKKKQKIKTLTPFFDKLERFGKFWVIVKERADDGYPLKVEPGLDDFGEKKKGAVYIECLITFVKNATFTKMIGFLPQRCRDITGKAYRPLIQALQYIHPTEDSGIGDGKPTKELQIALNDTINIGNDRVLFATMPMMKRKKFGNEDMATMDYYPGATLDLDDVKSLEEIVIKDNIQGTAIMAQFFKAMMEQAMAQSPTSFGTLPEDSSTTATAIAGASAQSTQRSGYKSLTFENTFLSPFYWMIQQLTWQYADETTANKLLGDMALDFDPDGDYYYKAVSQAIETEYSRATKIKNLLTLMGYTAQIPNPNTAKVLNFIMAKIFKLMGDEYETFGKALLDENAPVEGVTNVKEEAVPATNQSGIPASAIETNTSEVANV